MTDLDGVVRRGGLFVAGLGIVVALLVIVLFLSPGVVGAETSYVVLSDSMSPGIQAGDIVVVEPVEPSDLQEGDIITFQRARSNGPDRVTHRIVAVEETEDGRQFWTKGDANDQRDPQPVPGEGVVGSVWFSIPVLGYLFVFADTDAGLVVFVILPGLILVGNEFFTLYRDLSQLGEGQQ